MAKLWYGRRLAPIGEGAEGSAAAWYRGVLLPARAASGRRRRPRGPGGGTPGRRCRSRGEGESRRARPLLARRTARRRPAAAGAAPGFGAAARRREGDTRPGAPPRAGRCAAVAAAAREPAALRLRASSDDLARRVAR